MDQLACEQKKKEPGVTDDIDEDQTVRAWGNAKAGGDVTRVQQELWGVQWIQANCVSFFALRVDLTVIVWGETSAIYEHKVPVISCHR